MLNAFWLLGRRGESVIGCLLRVCSVIYPFSLYFRLYSHALRDQSFSLRFPFSFLLTSLVHRSRSSLAPTQVSERGCTYSVVCLCVPACIALTPRLSRSSLSLLTRTYSVERSLLAYTTTRVVPSSHSLVIAKR